MEKVLKIGGVDCHLKTSAAVPRLYRLKFNQDLIDYKNRDLITNETKDIRNILYVKAFANNDDFEDFNLASE